MRIRRLRWVAATAWMLIGLSGCGDHNNLLGSLANDTSIEAKIQDAQIALDKGDCQTAINGFTAAFNDDPNNVGIRVNLAAAYTCRAGFNVPALIGVVAKFSASGQTADQFNLFKVIADTAVNLVSATWDPDTTKAISYLSDPNPNLPTTTQCAPPPFANNPDAAFNEAIVATIRAVMAVAELQNAAGGVILTQSITPAVATLVGSALRDADNGIACSNSIAGGNAIVDTDVAQSIHELNQGLNGLDGNLTNPLTAAELQQYLNTQGFVIQ